MYDIGDSIELAADFTAKNTVGKVDAGSTALTVRDATGYAANDPIVVRGAGDVGGDLYTTVSGSPAGNVITLAAAAKTSVVRAPVGKLVAPGAVTFKVRLPDGTSVGPTAATTVSAGRYTGTFDPTIAGQHFYNFAGTSPAKATDEREFIVRERRVT